VWYRALPATDRQIDSQVFARAQARRCLLCRPAPSHTRATTAAYRSNASGNSHVNFSRNPINSASPRSESNDSTATANPTP
jgi:hypothetical protein